MLPKTYFYLLLFFLFVVSVCYAKGMIGKSEKPPIPPPINPPHHGGIPWNPLQPPFNPPMPPSSQPNPPSHFDSVYVQ